MNHSNQQSGVSELRSAIHASRWLIMSATVFSVFVNLLMLTGPLYMLQVYDRVLGSRSEPTLVALSALVLFLFLSMGLLEYARLRVLAVVGARFQEHFDRRVFCAAVERSAIAPSDQIAFGGQRDLEAIRTFLASPVLVALMDLPWTPFFLALLFVFHPMMGWLSVVGGLLLIGATILNQRLTKRLQDESGVAATVSDRFANQMKLDSETLQALGMTLSGFERWQIARRVSLVKGMAAASLSGCFGSLTKTFRLFLQSAMLGLGALLVLRGELSSGAMIAGSILMGRALSPVEVIVGQWAVAQRASEAWRRLSVLLSLVPEKQKRTELPRPRAFLEVQAVCVAPSGERMATLKGLSFTLEPGQALGVIGASGAGKSTLAKALTGVWSPMSGKIRLDGASLDQFDKDRLGRLIGYLPQQISLFDGTIADNIARLDPHPESARVVEAARKADAHEMILRLPQGYDTLVSGLRGRLSGGQVQRIGLARALYGDPVLVILDEPNSNLDSSGSMALNLAIRSLKAEGKSILIMAHRPAAIQECGLLLVLEDGLRKAFGPRDEILRDQIKSRTDILKPTLPGALA